jgi:hypothetical protein
VPIADEEEAKWWSVQDNGVNIKLDDGSPALAASRPLTDAGLYFSAINHS